MNTIAIEVYTLYAECCKTFILTNLRRAIVIDIIIIDTFSHSESLTWDFN